METTKSYQDLLNELKDLQLEMEETRFRLEEATDTIEAIRTGEVDALIVNDGEGHQLYTLKSADQTYRIFIEQMTEGAVTLNENGQILYSNSQFAKLVGLPLEKVTGKSFYKFITDDCLIECKSLIVKAWQGNTKGELSLITHSGQKIPALLSLKTLDLDEGLSLSVIITDLTEQKETQKLLEQKNQELEEAQKIAYHLNANLENTVKERTRELEINIREKTKIEENLRGNQQRLQSILDTMAEGVGIVDTDGKLIYANPMAQAIFGIKDGETALFSADNPGWQNLHIDGSPLLDDEHPMAIMFATQKAIYDHEIAIQFSEKERYYISINAAPLIDQNGKLNGGVVTFTDVTARRKTIQQKDDFISIASHELKTPVTSLKASIQLLERMKNNPSPVMLARLIDQSGRSLERLNNLINDLLNVNRITHGQLQLRKKQFVVGDMINNSSYHLRSVGVHQLNVSGDLDLSIYADEQRVDQVLINFLNNAVKYAPNSVEIIITVEKIDDDKVKIAVADKGPGILPEKVPHLFDRYYRADHSGAQFSGLGLGLYISAEIIKRHGGEIGVNSKLGTGSTFWFTLPIR